MTTLDLGAVDKSSDDNKNNNFYENADANNRNLGGWVWRFAAQILVLLFLTTKSNETDVNLMVNWNFLLQL